MYALERILAAALALPLLFALPACGDKKKDGEAKKEDGDKAKDDKKVEKKEISTLFTGDKVTMPAPFAGITPGMTAEEAKKANPELPEDGTIKTEEYPDTWFNVDIDDDTKLVSRVFFNLPKDKAVAAAKAAWGEPKEGTDLDRKVSWWFNPEAGLRMSMMDAFSEGETSVEITRYWPLAKLIGEGPEIAFEKDAPLLGLTVAELEQKYPDYIKKESAEDAAKTQEDVAKLAGDEAKALMGKPSASVDLEYPPTEWGKFWTPIQISWDDEGKIERYWFAIDYEPHPAARDEIMAFLKKKWGEPKEEEDLGDTVYVFSEDPRIEVKDDDISKAWDIYVEPKEG